jgi:uncharacterized membrane protein YraQ (UPF0718 family)
MKKLKEINNKNNKWILKFRQTFFKTNKSFLVNLPIILATLLLVNLIVTLIPPSFYKQLFTGNPLIDSIIGAVIGSISNGNPITSYIIGGELLKQGVNLVAITSFLVSWVTVGLIQLPAESLILGKKFAILRNLTAFIFSILVAIITVVLYEVL